MQFLQRALGDSDDHLNCAGDVRTVLVILSSLLRSIQPQLQGLAPSSGGNISICASEEVASGSVLDAKGWSASLGDLR